MTTRPDSRSLTGWFAPAMAEGQLERVAAEGAADELIAQADAHRRLGVGQDTHRLHDVAQARRVAGAGGQKDAVGVGGKDDLGGRVGGVDRDLHAERRQRAQDVELHAAVEQGDLVLRLAGRRGPDVGLFGGDLPDVILLGIAGGVGQRLAQFIGRLLGGQRPHHDADGAQFLGQRPRVQPRDADDVVVARNSSSVPWDRQLEGASASSLTMNPDTCTRRDSKSSGLTP